MRMLIQRVKHASVVSEGKCLGEIGTGLLVLLGVCESDTEKTADYMAEKLCRLRIFEDENGKTNRSLVDVGGKLLVVSQFTLYADCRKGNRPSFLDAGSPEHANQIYEYVLDHLKQEMGEVSHGEFGADMKVELLNDGPFTIMLDSRDLM